MAIEHTTKRGTDSNPDPITGAPGSHPVGTGVGAAGAGATGAAIGMAVGGPVGGAVGAVIGAITGGLAGKGVAEAIDPTAEDSYWRENYRNEPYAKPDRSYDDYAPAYRSAYENYVPHQGKKFEEVEDHLRNHYESTLSTPATSTGTGGSTSKTASALPWEEAKPAAKAAWNRIETGDAVRVPISEEQVKVGKRDTEAGAVRLRKEVHTEVVNTPVELRREEVVVERVAKGTPGAVPEDAFQEGEITVPLKREEAVVQKTAQVVGEVKLKKNSTTDTQNVQETVRKEEVKVERDGDTRIEKDRL